MLSLQLDDISYGRRRVTIRKRDDHPRGALAKSRQERVVDLHEPRTRADQESLRGSRHDHVSQVCFSPVRSFGLRAVLQYAEELGWRVDVRHNGHFWGRIFCPLASRAGCQMSVGSTPRNAGNEAKRIRRFVDNCTC